VRPRSYEKSDLVITQSQATSPQHVATHYDVLDRWYRELWGEHLHHGYWATGRETREQATCQLVALAARRAQLRAGAKVCDVGCGYGATGRQLVHEYGAQVTGLTISPAQHHYATSTGNGENPRVLLRDWFANGLPDESFDAVIAIESVQHMGDKTLALRECRRVLRPGGRLVLMDSLAGPVPRAWQQRLILRGLCREYHLPNLPTLADYEAMMREVTLEDVKGQDISRHTWPTWPLAVAQSTRKSLVNPELRRFLLDPNNSERALPLTMLRLIAGYALGAYRFGLLTARRGA
jgi:tocopherol O-methyltransferase